MASPVLALPLKEEIFYVFSCDVLTIKNTEKNSVIYRPTQISACNVCTTNMLKLYISLRGNVFFLSILCCDNYCACCLVRFRLKIEITQHHVLANIPVLPSANTAGDANVLLKNILYCRPTLGWKCSWGLLKDVQWCHAYKCWNSVVLDKQYPVVCLVCLVMFYLSVSLGLNLYFILWQCCVNDLVRLRDKNHLVRVRKRSCFCLIYLFFLSSQTRLWFVLWSSHKYPVVSHLQMLKFSLELQSLGWVAISSITPPSKSRYDSQVISTANICNVNKVAMVSHQPRITTIIL